MKNICIVIPTLNERQGIEEIIEKIKRTTPAQWIVVVDDGSQDGTIEFIKNAQTNDPGLILIQRNAPKSFAQSYIEGFNKALELGADIIIQMDADGSHDPAVVNQMVENLGKYDFVIGSRYVAGGGISNWSKIRLALSFLGNLYARLILGIPIKDVTGGYNAWRVETLRSINLPRIECTGYIFLIWLKYRAWKNHHSFIELPIIFAERKSGASKLHGGIFLESLFGVIKLRLTKHLK